MQFNIGSILIALAITSSVAATPAKGTTKRDKATSDGACNGTSCRVGFENYACNRGSCASDGGDGSPCTVVDHDDGSRTTFCPGCGDPNLC